MHVLHVLAFDTFTLRTPKETLLSVLPPSSDPPSLAKHFLPMSLAKMQRPSLVMISIIMRTICGGALQGIS